MKGKNIYICFLFIFPIILYILTFYIVHAYYSNDPEYAYLLNALNLANFEKVGHTDHPGTTLQVLGAIILRIYHFFDFPNKSELRNSVLLNPEHYVMIIINVLQMINVLLNFLVGFILYKLSKNVWLGIIAQSFSLLSIIVIEVICTKFTPEALLIINSSFLAIVLFYFNFKNNNQDKIFTILFSVIIGFGIATKITSLPLIIIPLVLLKGFRRKLSLLLYTSVSFVFFTIPIFKQYGSFLKWIINLFDHTGIYGQGESGIISISKYKRELFFLIESNLVIFSIIAFSILFILISVFLKRNNKNVLKEVEYKVLLGLTLSEIFGFLMVAKHPGIHYLTPFLCLGSINIVYIIIILNKIFHFSINWLSLTAISLWTIFFYFTLIPQIKNKHFSYLIARNEFYQANKIIGSLNDYYIISSYPYSFNKYSALNFGDVYSKGKNHNSLILLYPSACFYDYRYNKFYGWDGLYSNFDIFVFAKKSKLLLLSSYIDVLTKNNIQSLGIKLRNIYNSKDQQINELIINIDSIAKIKNLNSEKKYYQALLKVKIQRIYEDSKWLEIIERKAKVNKISLDSAIVVDANWVIQNSNESYYNELIKEKIHTIRDDEKWLELLKVKAKKQNISLDSVIYLDAKWVIDNYGY